MMNGMMGSGSWDSGGVWIGPVLVLVIMVLVAVILLAPTVAAPLDRRRTWAPRQPRIPEQVVRERYAHGELTTREYRRAMAATLQDRYVRGEIALDEYEARLDRLFTNRQPERS